MQQAAWALIFAASAAHAVDFEMAVGASKYSDVGNMTWYQEGLPHDLRLVTPAIQVGATGAITSWLDWHAGYAYLGQVKTDAIATPDDANYDPVAKQCRGECIAHSRFMRSGDVHGIYLTLEPHVDYKGWRFGVHAGPFLHVSRWKMRVDNWIPAVGHEPRTIEVSHKSKIGLGAVVGVSMSRGNWSVQYQRFYDKPKSDEPNGDFPPIWRHTDMLSVRYRF